MVFKRNKSGIYNVGTGKATSFNKVAEILKKNTTSAKIKYITFPKITQILSTLYKSKPKTT